MPARAKGSSGLSPFRYSNSLTLDRQGGAAYPGGGEVPESERMTEAEWLACTDPQPMLEFLQSRVSDSKWRRFGCVCCRYVWDHLTDGSRSTVELLEQFEEGRTSSEELSAASRWASFFISNLVKDPSRGAWFLAVVGPAIGDHHLREPVRQLLREVVGNPFRSLALDHAWRTPTVTALATAAYEERHLPAGTLDADRLAILADALEDAGCTDADILSHLRGPAPHVHGCWVLDLLLGKS